MEGVCITQYKRGDLTEDILLFLHMFGQFYYSRAIVGLLFFTPFLHVFYYTIRYDFILSPLILIVVTL